MWRAGRVIQYRRRRAGAVAGTLLIGMLVFVLQAKLPHKKMLIATGIMIDTVLLIMVGNTVHVLQVVGWLPIHPIRSLALPYWSGLLTSCASHARTPLSASWKSTTVPTALPSCTPRRIP